MDLQCVKIGPRSVLPHESLWRYVRLPQLLLLLKGQVSLPSIRALQRHDRLEGRGKWDEVVQAVGFEQGEYGALVDYVRQRRMSQRDRDLFLVNSPKHPKANQRKVLEIWSELLVSTRYALCLFQSPQESMAMWRLYAADGVAIRTSLSRLDAALAPTQRPWLASRMIYRDLSRELTGDDAHNDEGARAAIRRPFFLKRKEFEGENEVRLVTVDPARRTHLLLTGVHPEDWIEEIRISPDIWPGDATLIQELIAESKPALARLIRHSPVREEPELEDSAWKELDAEVNREDAEHWPEFLRVP